MKPIREIVGRAFPLGLKNCDTDVIIPAHYLKTITRQGLGRGAFETIRAQPGNIFDDPEYAGAKIIVECGPGGVLAGLVQRISRRSPVQTFALETPESFQAAGTAAAA